jgi:hypothetical protein
MKRFLAIVFVCLFCFASTVYATEYWAGPTDLGDCTAVGTPGSASECLALLSCGDTLWLNDGHYTGAGNMMDTYAAGEIHVDCTEQTRIYVKAVNDGEVWFDGRDGGSGTPDRIPCRFGTSSPLDTTDYWTVEGINCSDSTGSAIGVYGSDYVELKRIVAWDADSSTNTKVFGVSVSNNLLVEDCAGFGTGRKVFTPYSSTGSTFRRTWGRWEGSSRSDPKMTYTTHYASSGNVYDNVIGTIDGTSPETEDYGIISMDAVGDGVDPDVNIYGSIFYLENGADMDAPRNVYFSKMGDIHLTDVVSYVGSSQDKMAFGLYAKGTATVTPTATGLTSIGSNGDVNHADWTITDLDSGATVNDVSSIWSSSTGAQICYRYEDGVLGSTPLWPWPMDQRIYDALGDAGKTQFYITDKMEELFGTIPAACSSIGTGSIGAPTPLFLRQ